MGEQIIHESPRGERFSVSGDRILHREAEVSGCRTGRCDGVVVGRDPDRKFLPCSCVRPGKGHPLPPISVWDWLLRGPELLSNLQRRRLALDVARRVRSCNRLIDRLLSGSFLETRRRGFCWLVFSILLGSPRE